MAIYHYSAQIIGRSKGQSAVAAAAYRSGTAIKDERTGLIHNYQHKSEVAYTNILAPSLAPDWIIDRSQLWNQVEQIERMKNSQLAREINIALPVELSLVQNIQLIERFAQEQFVKQGMVVDLAIHNKPNNPHAHLLLSTRVLQADGFGLKERSWNDRALLKVQRQAWADACNAALEEAGVDSAPIDARSLEDQGIVDRFPQIHLGSYAASLLHQYETTGILVSHPRLERYLEIEEENRQLAFLYQELEQVKAVLAQEREQLAKQQAQREEELRQARLRQEAEQQALQQHIFKERQRQQQKADCPIQEQAQQKQPPLEPAQLQQQSQESLPASVQRDPAQISPAQPSQKPISHPQPSFEEQLEAAKKAIEVLAYRFVQIYEEQPEKFSQGQFETSWDQYLMCYQEHLHSSDPASPPEHLRQLSILRLSDRTPLVSLSTSQGLTQIHNPLTRQDVAKFNWLKQRLDEIQAKEQSANFQATPAPATPPQTTQRRSKPKKSRSSEMEL